MPTADEILLAAKSLNRAEQRQLIARLSESISRENVPPPTDEGLALLRQPWAKSDVVRKLIAGRHSASSAKIYSAPRRFDLATIFVVTAAYSLLMAVTSWIANGLNAPPIASLVVAAFITLVGVGQAISFGGKKPRLASCLFGVLGHELAFMTLGWPIIREQPSWNVLPLLLMIAAQSITLGAFLGYLAGTLVGGVFLVADNLRRSLRRASTDEAAKATGADSPFAVEATEETSDWTAKDG